MEALSHPTTPVSPKGLTKYDGLPAGEAVLKAWTEYGNNPEWHHRMRLVVRDVMPLLERALSRMEAEH